MLSTATHLRNLTRNFSTTCGYKQSIPTQLSKTLSLEPLQTDVLRKKIKDREPGRPLPREWYISEGMFNADMKYLFGRSWLFAGFECQITNPGDYFTYQVGNENILILKDDNNDIKAFFNVCRHRGARLCPESEGKLRNITCPYHSWTYSKKGDLIKANHLDSNFDYSKASLIPCNVRAVEGLIFINLSDNPLPFDPAAELFKPELHHHNLKDAKIAYYCSEVVNANWKLVYENNRECYHCPNAHPEYIKANYDLSFTYSKNEHGSYVRTVDPSVKNKDEVEKHIKDCNERWKKYGLSCATHNTFPGDGWYRASRMPLRKGWTTESIDGKSIAPIMGNFDESDRDMGSLRIHTLPNFWIHVSSDYASATRLTPIDSLHTLADQYWLVNKNAKEGVDYFADKILPFWQKTNQSDWEICTYTQQGVLSERYSPSLYTEKKEGGVETFVRWYLNTLSKNLEQK